MEDVCKREGEEHGDEVLEDVEFSKTFPELQVGDPDEVVDNLVMSPPSYRPYFN